MKASIRSHPSLAPFPRLHSHAAPRLALPSRRRDVRTVPNKLRVAVPERVEVAPKEQQKHKTAEKTFDWFKQWYAVAVEDDLDTTRPYPLEVLGMYLVLWKDGTGKWRCFQNACPHRAAPLSEGRIEKDGNLLCSYHAWRFNGEGKCVSLPQAKDEASYQKISKMERSCAKSHPVRIDHGVVWVWADCSPTAFIDCQVRPPAILPELNQELPPGYELSEVNSHFRDLPYGWDYTQENVMDRAHLAISHHGITGSRYEDAYFMDTDLKMGATLQDGFKSSLKTLTKGVAAVDAIYTPPCLWKAIMTFEDGAQDFVILYSTPKRPGVTRWVGLHYMIRPKKSISPASGFAQSPIKLPIWLRHIVITMFIHQDMAFLHFQERFLARARKGQDLQEKYFMPCPQDKDVIAFRRWIDRAGGVPYVGYEPGYVPPMLPEEKIFDFYDAHVKHCTKCQGALKNLKLMRIGLWAAAAACLVRAMILTTQKGWFPKQGVIVSAVGVVILGMIYLVNNLVDRFYGYSYSHADND